MSIESEINVLLRRAQKLGYTRASLARACGLSPNALRGLDFSPFAISCLGTSNLTMSTIRAIEDVVGTSDLQGRKGQILAVDVPPQIASAGDNRISRALDLWRRNPGAVRFGADIGNRPSLLQRRADGDFHLFWGDHAARYGFIQHENAGDPLSTFEDKNYEVFTRDRMIQVFESGLPQVLAIDAIVQNPSGEVSLRYWSLLLPLGTEKRSEPTEVLSVVLLESDRIGAGVSPS